MELCQLNASYMVVLNDYNKILKMRNDYLKKSLIDFPYLRILTNYLVDRATQLIIMRKKFVDRLNEIVPSIYENIAGLSNFKVVYKPSIFFENYEYEYIKERLVNTFLNHQDVELKCKTTMFGPHKDDFEFYIGKYNVRTYGSQGQQRMAILSLKLSEITIFKKYKETIPILLLDDVFSELDDKKKNNLLHYIDGEIQTIITITDINNIDSNIIKKSKIIEIENGKLK